MIQCLQYKVLLNYIPIVLMISGTKWEVTHQKILLVMGTNLHKRRHKNLATDFSGAD